MGEIFIVVVNYFKFKGVFGLIVGDVGNFDFD